MKQGLKVQIINYDSYKKNLEAIFFISIGFKNLINQIAIPKQKYQNISSTISQTNCLLKLSRINPKLIRFLEYKYQRLNLLKNEKENIYFKNLDVDLLNFYKVYIHDINKVIIGSKLRHKPRNLKSNSIKISEHDLNVLNDFLNELKNKKKISMLTKIKNLIFFLLTRGQLPLNFNEKLYLILNYDVYKQSINPYTHYINHGKSEKRIYKL